MPNVNGRFDSRKSKVLKLESKNDRVMNGKSGDDDPGEWDDRGRVINEEKLNQDVTDEVSEEVNSRS